MRVYSLPARIERALILEIMAEQVEKKARMDGGKVAIIGSGLIGRSWAALFLRGGYSVVVYDVISEQVGGAMKAVADQLGVMEREGLLRDGHKADDLVKRLTSSSTVKDAIEGAVYVQVFKIGEGKSFFVVGRKRVPERNGGGKERVVECTPENLSLKQKVFTELDSLADDDVILASSTSCIVPSKFTSDLQHKSQCIVAHPVNPPQYVPLVEVVPSPWTADKVVTATMDLMKELGQSPVLVKKEINGFILNRLQYALIMEAWRLVEDGVASPEDVDKAMVEGLGRRYAFIGVFETMHLNAAEGMDDYCKRYGENIKRVCESQTPARDLSGNTLTTVTEAMTSKVPLEKLEERREWREKRLAALVSHTEKMKSLEKE